MVKLDDSKSAPPLYLQIKQILKEKIERGEYLPGDILPSESELQTLFRVSRITVRNAINELVFEGYVSRSRGRGTEVIYNKIEESLNHIMSFTKEMEERGFKVSTKFAKIDLIQPSLTICKLLDIEENGKAFKLERLRCVNGEPIVFFTTYLRGNLNLSLDEKDYMGSLYELLREKNHVVVSKVKENIESILASSEMAAYLNIKEHAPVLKRTRLSYDQEGKALEYTICYYRGDKYMYSIEIETKGANAFIMP